MEKEMNKRRRQKPDYEKQYGDLFNQDEIIDTTATEWEKTGDNFKILTIYDDSQSIVEVSGNTTLTKKPF